MGSGNETGCGNIRWSTCCPDRGAILEITLFDQQATTGTNSLAFDYVQKKCAPTLVRMELLPPEMWSSVIAKNDEGLVNRSDRSGVDLGDRCRD